MEIFTVGKELFLLGIRYFLEHKVLLVILAIFCVVVIFLVIKGLRNVLKSKINPLIRICAYAYIAVSVLLVMLTGSACLVASDVFEANPQTFNTSLYIAVVIISVVSVILESAVLKANKAAPDDLGDSTKQVLKSVIAVIGSLIFIFTDLELSLMGFGPTILHRTIGEWIFNFYSGLAVTAILGFVQFLLTWPLLPWFKVGMDAIDEA